MKNYLFIRASILSLVLVLISCGGEDDSQTNNCGIPSNFEVTLSGIGNQLALNWDAIEEVESYEVEYGLTGFNQGEGTIDSYVTSQALVNGLDAGTAYDFYVRSICTDGVSNWFGPVAFTTAEETSVTTFMNANIGGTQYNNMVPFLPGFGNLTRVVYFPFTDDPYLAIQGNSDPFNATFPNNTKEINLFIPQTQWAPGTYLLYNDSVLNNVSQSNVNIIYNDISVGPTQAYEEDNGTITITEFDLQERVIKGTFEFGFRVYNVTTGETSNVMQCLDGEFTYELDADFFD